MIETFKDKGKANFKDDERMPLDSAIWYLEATANYTYGDGSQEIERIVTDSTFISLEINDDSIVLSEVYTKYEIMIDSIRAYYYSLQYSNRQLITVNVEPASLTSTLLTCKVI